MIGLILVVVTAGLLLALTLIKRKASLVFRDIPAFTRMKRAIGVTVEDGTRLHVSLGRGGLQTSHGAPALPLPAYFVAVVPPLPSLDAVAPLWLVLRGDPAVLRQHDHGTLRP